MVKAKGKSPACAFELVSGTGVVLEILLGRTEDEKDSIKKELEQVCIQLTYTSFICTHKRKHENMHTHSQLRTHRCGVRDSAWMHQG